MFEEIILKTMPRFQSVDVDTIESVHEQLPSFMQSLGSIITVFEPKDLLQVLDTLQFIVVLCIVHV